MADTNLQFAEAPAAPSLSFDSAPVTEEAPEIKKAASQDASVLDENVLSEEERRQVKEFVSQIDLANSSAVMNYGAGTQRKMADFSEKALESVRTKDMGEVGDMITGLVTQLKNFDVDEEAKGLKAFFKKSGNSLMSLKVKYSKVETNVNDITKELERHQITLMKDVDMLDRMYDQNLNYYKELTMYIMAGKQKLQEAKETTLKELQAKAEQSGLPEDAQAAKDYASLVDRFEKKIYDLELTRNISMQMAPQIRLIQNNDTVMSEKIQSTIVNTIPLWKSQMVIAIGLDHSQDAAKAQRQVTDATNELLRKNAEALKMASIETARESERGIVDIETLTQTNQTLIDTLDEVMKIQDEGRVKRAEAEQELARIEDQMRNKILEVSKVRQ